MVGLPVLTVEGERLGEVEELLLGRGGRRVIGFLLAGGSVLGGRRVYPYEEVRSIGNAAVVVARPQAVLRTRRRDRLARLLAGHQALVGKRLLDGRGDDLGVVTDLVFDPADGTVLGYELSGGFVRDVTEGRRFLPSGAPLVIGRDVALWSGPGEEE